MERRRSFLQRRAGLGTTIAVRDCEEGPSSIESAAEEHLCVPGLLEAVPVVEEEGTDAIVVGCFGDPGLSAAREVASVPVVGPGQASVHLAAQLGSRVGVLTVVDEVVPAIRRQMRGHGLDGFVHDVRAVEVPVLELRRRRAEVATMLEDEARDAIDAGVEVLVLGCMTMGFLDVAADLQARVGVPVVNPVLAGLQLAETMVAAGVTPSRKSYPKPRKALGCAVT